MNISNIKPDQIVLVHPITYKRYKREFDKAVAHVITANCIKQDKIIEWNSKVRIK